jgi:hypothetical protein
MMTMTLLVVVLVGWVVGWVGAEELAGLRKEMVVCSVANRYARKPSLDGAALLPLTLLHQPWRLLLAAGCWLVGVDPGAAYPTHPSRGGIGGGVADVLGLGLHTGVRRLELFARNLRPGWTSWGTPLLLSGDHSLTPAAWLVVHNKQATRCCCFRSAGTSNQWRTTRAT